MTAPRWDHLLMDATLATFAGERPFGSIERGALAIKDGAIAWVGAMADLPGSAGSNRSPTSRTPATSKPPLKSPGHKQPLHPPGYRLGLY